MDLGRLLGALRLLPPVLREDCLRARRGLVVAHEARVRRRVLRGDARKLAVERERDRAEDLLPRWG